MSIRLLDQATIDKIAAGEVIERPASIVKELIENAIDAKATRIAIEIKEGGVTYLRVTDNGRGIPQSDLPLAFCRHATSKIEDVGDLLFLSTLGFRGEALSSIAASSRVECISKTADQMSAGHYVIEGGIEKAFTEIGAPDGTSIIVRDLFFNTPARGKFLKTAMTESAHIGSFVEQMALSHPGIAFSFIADGKERLTTSGNGALRDVIFSIYGREVTEALLPVPETSFEGISVHGFIAKPHVSRGNRNYENYFVNGRIIKSRVVDLAIEDGYGTRLMQHRYPFCCLFIDLPGDLVDVNVHPTKQEVRFLNEKSVYHAVMSAVDTALADAEMIIRTELQDAPDKAAQTVQAPPQKERHLAPAPFETPADDKKTQGQLHETPAPYPVRQTSLFDRLPKVESAPLRRIIGVAFHTYWIVEFEETLFLIDQHAAHEKILYERLMRSYRENKVSAQQIAPPLVLSLSSREQALVRSYQEALRSCGYQFEDFGGNEIRLTAVPHHLSRFSPKEFFLFMLAALEEQKTAKEEIAAYVDRVAQESCKAAVKGGDALSFAEAKSMIDELFTLDDPYHCPHGRPTIISFTERDLEKRFKRIL